MAKRGRPRTTALPENEMIALGKEMVAWVKENDPIHIKQWYCIHKGFTYRQWKRFIEKEEFQPYYEQATGIVSLKYMDGTINASIAHRFLRVYFNEVREYEDAALKHEIELKRNELEAKTEELKRAEEALNAHCKQLSDVQSALKIASNNNNNDIKS